MLPFDQSMHKLVSGVIPHSSATDFERIAVPGFRPMRNRVSILVPPTPDDATNQTRPQRRVRTITTFTLRLSFRRRVQRKTTHRTDAPGHAGHALRMKVMPATRRQYPGNVPVQPIQTDWTRRRKFSDALLFIIIIIIIIFLPEFHALHEHAPANLLVVQAAKRLPVKVVRKHPRVFAVVEEQYRREIIIRSAFIIRILRFVAFLALSLSRNNHSHFFQFHSHRGDEIQEISHRERGRNERHEDQFRLRRRRITRASVLHSFLVVFFFFLVFFLSE